MITIFKKMTKKRTFCCHVSKYFLILIKKIFFTKTILYDIMKIETISLSKLVNASHLQLMNRINALIIAKGTDASTLDIAAEYQLFKDSLLIEEESQRNEGSSALTIQLANVDTYRDNLYKGFCLIVEGNLNHFDANIVASAQRITRIIDKYGNPTNLPYDQETTKLASLIADLEAASADVDKLSLLQWVPVIKKANTDFVALVSSRSEEHVKQIGPSVKEARAITDARYRTIFDRINALAILKSSSTITTFILGMNDIIADYRTIIAIKEGKANTASKPSTESAQTVSHNI